VGLWTGPRGFSQLVTDFARNPTNRPRAVHNCNLPAPDPRGLVGLWTLVSRGSEVRPPGWVVAAQSFLGRGGQGLAPRPLLAGLSFRQYSRSTLIFPPSASWPTETPRWPAVGTSVEHFY
jgi:hypothetical protein